MNEVKSRIKIPHWTKMVKLWKCIWLTKMWIYCWENDNYRCPTKQVCSSLHPGGAWEVHARITFLYTESMVRTFGCICASTYNSTVSSFV